MKAQMADTVSLFSETETEPEETPKHLPKPPAARDSGPADPHPAPWYLMAAFFVPLVLMYLIYIGMEVFPFGKNSVLVLDLNGQYVYYFEYFREIIHGDASLLYSWTRSLGGEFLGIFSYYLCSPFSLIVALLPKTMMTEALLLLILAKVGMCGVTMAYYLRTSRGVSRYTAVLFGTMYALCAYGVIQAMNTMWIDAMYLLPIVLLGCERLLRGKNPLLYCVTLAILMLTNYYIGFMVCIFLVLYFFYYFFSQEELTVGRFVRAGLRFALYSLIAAAIAAILLIPAYYGLTFGKTTFQQTNYDFMQRFDFLDFLTKFLPASYDTVRPEGLPVVYSGLLTVLFAPLFFIAPGISNREKVWSGILVVLLVMSMNASTVDIFWHGMSKPNWLNYRYSFMLCFFLIMLAAQAYQRFEGMMEETFGSRTGKDAPAPANRIAYKSLLVVGLALFAMIVMIQKEDYEYIDDLNCIWVSLAFLGGYLITLHPISCGAAKTAGKAFLAAICAGELFVAGLSDLVALDQDVVFSNRQPYADFMARFRPAVEGILENDDDLYRMEKTVHRKVNDNMALGIRGISHSTSDLNAAVIRYLGELGYASRSHWSKYLGGTPVSDALIGIRYVIAEEEVSDLYEEVAVYDDLYTYKNPYALGVVNTVNDELFDYDPEEDTTPFRRLNDLVTMMLGEDETVMLFQPIDIDSTDYTNCDYGFTTGHKKYSPEIEGKTASLTYTVTIPTDDRVYIYFPSDWAREGDLTLNGEDFGTYFGNETRRIVTLGEFLPGEMITLQMTLTEEDLYIGTGVDYFYYLDEALYEEIMPRLTEYAMDVTAWDDTYIEGTVKTDADHTLIYTSIPYDEGWNVTVDGEEAEITTVCGALLAVDASALPEGEHTVVLSYMPDCYVYALFISVGGIVLLILCMGIRALSGSLRERKNAMLAESVTPDTDDDSTACIPLSELLAQDVPAADAPVQNAQDAPDEDAPSDVPPDAEDTDEITPEDAEAVLRDLFGEDADTETPAENGNDTAI
ncbi:MAG: YfhO family protein [Clostridia bacterium]|nr:YfhO family protein [Clostridia bacterium]